MASTLRCTTPVMVRKPLSDSISSSCTAFSGGLSSCDRRIARLVDPTERTLLATSPAYMASSKLKQHKIVHAARN